MSIKPILFNADMVRALLGNRKTATRRVVKPQPKGHAALLTTNLLPETIEAGAGAVYAFEDGTVTSPPYRPGDILYVREVWRVQSARRFDADARIMFKAGGDMVRIQFPDGGDQYHSRRQYDAFVHKWADDRWHPSIHMPREAARIFQRVTDVRVERLQDIDDDGVVAEGLEIGAPFDELWDSTIKKADRARYGWDANPWVWVIEFERCEKPEESAHE